MNRTIDGVTYDTATASKVAFLQMSVDQSTLYRTSEGELFYDLYDAKRETHTLAPVNPEEATRFCKMPGVDILDDVFGIGAKR